MVIGSKESSCKVKAEGWKVSTNTRIKVITVDTYPYWYRGIAKVPRYKRGGQDESAVFHCSLYLTNQQYAVGQFLSDELSPSKLYRKFEVKKKTRWHRENASDIVHLFAGFLCPSHRIGRWGREKALMGLSTIPTPSSLPCEISRDSFNSSHKLLVEKRRSFSIIAEHLESLSQKGVFPVQKRDWHIAVQREEALKEVQ